MFRLQKNTSFSAVCGIRVPGIERFKTYFQSSDASVMVEFAFVLPLLILLGFGSAEITRFILLNQKVEKTAAVMSDVVAQMEFVQRATLEQVAQGVDLLVVPFDAGENTTLIISSLSRFEDEGDLVNWQFTGGGTYGAESRVGAEGDVPNLPLGFTLEDGENVIVAEFFYRYRFFVMPNLLPMQDIYKAVYFKPRKVPLEELGA